jgi:DNA-binding transcriptional LysR family regulator
MLVRSENSKMPSLVDHLTAFIEVAETGSFSVAARRLNRAVSSVSYSITQLEAQCGFPLLQRRAKRSELTERGRALYGEAKAVVEGARRFTSHAASLERGAETRLRIAVDVLFPLGSLHSALKQFVTMHERVHVQLFNSSLNSLWEELRGGLFDFALSLVATIPLDVEGRSFKQITLAPVAAANHRLAQLNRPLALSDFQRERQLYFVGSPTIATERVGRVFSLDVWTANDLEQIRLLVRNGFGWSFGSEEFFREELRDGTVRMLSCTDAQLQPVRTASAVWLADHQPGPLGRELIRLVGESVGAAPAAHRAAKARPPGRTHRRSSLPASKRSRP